MIERRSFIVLVALTTLLLPAPGPLRPAHADDGGHDDGGHDDGGHDDGGHDDGGHNNDDGGGDNNNDNGANTSNHPGTDQDQALRAVRNGSIISLKKALGIVDTRFRGKVIDVKLVSILGRAQYRIKMRHSDGVISTIRLDAKTGAFVGILGF